jgi:hypothetical protein
VAHRERGQHLEGRVAVSADVGVLVVPTSARGGGGGGGGGGGAGGEDGECGGFEPPPQSGHRQRGRSPTNEWRNGGWARERTWCE